MNTSNVIFLERRVRKEKMPITSIYTTPSHLFCFNRYLGRALRTISLVIVIVF